jgi:hypothetical protein
MTEQEWLDSTDPTPMLLFLKRRPTNRSVKQRKLRLFSAACCRRIWPLITHKKSRAAVLVAERFADGQATSEELQTAESEANAIWLKTAGDNVAFACLNICSKEVNPFYVSVWAARAVWEHQEGKDQSYDDDPRMVLHPSPAEQAEQCSLIRDIFGNPFQPLPPKRGRKKWEQMWRTLLAWNDGTVQKVAQAIYEDRTFDRLPILADALEEAGCQDQDILGHCRSGGEHVRGCWLVDLLLGKS